MSMSEFAYKKCGSLEPMENSWEALAKARETGFDLVEVAANSRPPVCRIMDYGRYKYEQKKKRTGKNKQAHVATLKEVKMRPGTDMHDLNFKLNKLTKQSKGRGKPKL